MVALAIATLSCKKVQEEDPVIEQEPQAEEFEIVGVIHNAEDAIDVKTQYSFSPDEASATSAIFSWTAGDNIQLIVHNNDSFKEYVLSARSTSPTSTFQDNGNNERNPIGSIMQDGYDHTGYAIYPVVAPSALTYERGSSNTDVIVNLPSTYTLTTLENQLSMVPMIGVRSGSTNVYDFYAGVGVLAFKLSDVPTSATQVRITSLDENKPLSGKFHLQSNGSIAIENKAGSNSVSRTVTLPNRDSKQDITLYIPLPVGDIAANGIRIELLDGSSTPIFKRKYPNAFSIEQGVILRVNMGTPEWKKLGTGKFIDNFLWGKIMASNNSYSDALDDDIPDYVPVVIEQNIADPSQYRLVNPYGVAAAQFGYVPRATNYHAPDAYFTFTINSDSSVGFNQHTTGITVDSAGKTEDLIDGGSSYDKLISGERFSPKVVNLSPKYRYFGETSDGATYNRTNIYNQIQIIFPSAIGEYQPIISNIGQDVSNMLSSFSLTYSSPRTRLILARNNAIKISYDGAINTGGVDRCNFTSNDASIKRNSYINASGKWYLNWFVLESANNLCYQQGSIPFYALSAEDAAKVVGTFLRDVNQATPKKTSGTSATAEDDCLSLLGGNTLTIQKSDDVSKGNIMITGFAGYTYDLSGVLPTEGLTAGKKVYGSFNGAKAEFAANKGAADAFYTDGLTPCFISPCSDATSNKITLNYSENTLTANHNYFGIAKTNWIGNNSGGYVIYYEGSNADSRYKAQKTQGMIPLTVDMLSAFSTLSSAPSVPVDRLGGLAGLINRKGGNGNSNASWWCDYNATSTKTHETQGIWIQIDLGGSKTVRNFTLQFRTTYEDHGSPTKYRVAVSKDGNSWSFVTDEITIGYHKNTWHQKRIAAGDDYRYVRLCLTEAYFNGPGVYNSLLDKTIGSTPSSPDGTIYVNLDELQLWEN